MNNSNDYIIWNKYVQQVRNWFYRSFLSSPLQHDARVRKIQAQVAEWNKLTVSPKPMMCTARWSMVIISFRNHLRHFIFCSPRVSCFETLYIRWTATLNFHQWGVWDVTLSTYLYCASISKPKPGVPKEFPRGFLFKYNPGPICLNLRVQMMFVTWHDCCLTKGYSRRSSNMVNLFGLSWLLLYPLTFLLLHNHFEIWGFA